MRTLNKKMKSIPTAILAVGLLVGLSACEDGQTSQKAESDNRQSGYDYLVENQPGKTMKYSPTRETINFWVDTWGEPGKLAYVYMQNADGRIINYGIFEGLPVSYCAAISPTYEIKGNSSNQVVVPAPANDGAFYSGDGCGSTYYAKDAESGAYVEYTVGLGINILLYDQPLPGSIAGDAIPLSPTTS